MGNYNRAKAIEVLKEADELILNATDSDNIDYSVMNDSDIIIELMSTLQLASRQIRFLENNK